MLRTARKQWNSFRKQILESDGFRCVKCGKGEQDGATLQVHHKYYLIKLFPWEYPYDACETLCKGCHAQEHGVIRPLVGWTLVGYDDLGDLEGECELCGTQIRHVFTVFHEKWPPLQVGEFCCDGLTGNTYATAYMDDKRRDQARQKRFINSPRWQEKGTGAKSLIQDGLKVEVVESPSGYILKINKKTCCFIFSSQEKARAYCYWIFSSGKAHRYFK